MAAIGAFEAAQAFAKAVENADIPVTATVSRADLIRGLSKFKDEKLGGTSPPLTYGDGTSPNPPVKRFYVYRTTDEHGLRNDPAPHPQALLSALTA